ncbi:MAG: MarR family transcriptional regulator [Nocardioides sp.]|uniref:MarR family winged helix-turn-helix transcriptional regulator n=1 Tax=Nocardioides sp. TaxID=35761 RepID=UPI0039E315D0
MEIATAAAADANAVPADDGADPFLSFVDVAVADITAREPSLDEESMRLVLLLHRVTNSIVYDLESTVHRPAGWTWAAFRLLFTLWVTGPVDSKTAASTSGMSRPAVTALVRTLERDGLIQRLRDPNDGRSVVITLTAKGHRQMSETFRQHNERERNWMSALSGDERQALMSALTKLSAAAHSDWVSRR